MDEQTFTPRKKVYKPRTIIKPGSITDSRWYGIDLRGQGILNLSKNLFFNTFIYELNLENNQISTIPPEIQALKNLQILNIASNKIKVIPPEIGKLINLREINASSNYLTILPTEIGSLFNCDSFNLENNPLLEPFSSIYSNSGGRAIILFCKENHTNYPSPLERQWVSNDECLNFHTRNTTYYGDDNFIFSLGSYNFLKSVYATEDFYGYVPSWVLKWDLRKEKLIDEIVGYSLDILCAQEVETQAFISFFRNELEHRCDYDSLFYPKGRARTMGNNFSQVDGCATFWKRHRFNLIEQKCVEFIQVILADKRFNENIDIINRNMNKDNIALITVLRNKDTTLIVSNVHIFWDPEFKDVKLIQCIILTEEIMKLKTKYPTAGIMVVGDFNTLQVSDTYRMLMSGKLGPYSDEFNPFNYNPFAINGYEHSLNLKDCYKRESKGMNENEIDDNLTLTNYTANFSGVIDYIFHNEAIECLSVLSGIDESYIKSVIGFPTIHLPSDHILIAGKFNYKIERNKKDTAKNNNIL